jgi:predicted DNA-binding protein YlxM (UPF0122 family)
MVIRRDVDWEAIEQEFRAGQLSVADIARKHDISHQAIFQRAKRKGWKRDLTAAVKNRTQQKLVADVADRNATDDEIAEAAADRAANIVRSHRADIAALRELEANLIKELDSNPTKLYISTYRGKIIEKTVSLTASERAQAANNLANVQHKRIQLERQAFSIGSDSDEDIVAILYKNVPAEKREALNKAYSRALKNDDTD